MAKYQIELEKEYATLQKHLDTIYSFRDKHGTEYYLVWMEGLSRKSEEVAAVEEARRALRAYWKTVKTSYEDGLLPLPKREFLTGHMVSIYNKRSLRARSRDLLLQ